MNKKSMAVIRQLIGLFGPAFLSGFTFPQWVRLLQENRWDIDAQYIPRAVMATLGTMGTSLLKPLEPSPRLDEECEELWRRPVFIVGLPRSGTTHLFKLMAKDQRFCFPSRFECYNPHTFLLLQKIGISTLLGLIPEKRRAMDNVKNGWLSPEEDQIALTILAGRGVRLAAVFPRRRSWYRSLVFGSSKDDVYSRSFREALEFFSRKLVGLHRRSALFKSPLHGMMIPEILKIFPEARFVGIFRNPARQFSSLAAMLNSNARDFSCLHDPPSVDEDTMLSDISLYLKRYFASRDMIPAGRLVEIRYEELVAKESETLDKIHAALDLGPRTSTATNHDQRHFPYQKNTHPELTDDLKARIAKVYAPHIDSGLFDTEGLPRATQ